MAARPENERTRRIYRLSAEHSMQAKTSQSTIHSLLSGYELGQSCLFHTLHTHFHAWVRQRAAVRGHRQKRGCCQLRSIQFLTLTSGWQQGSSVKPLPQERTAPALSGQGWKPPGTPPSLCPNLAACHLPSQQASR